MKGILLPINKIHQLLMDKGQLFPRKSVDKHRLVLQLSNILSDKKINLNL